MFSDVLSAIKTRDDINEALSILDQLEQTVFKTNHNEVEQFVSESANYKLGKILISNLSLSTDSTTNNGHVSLSKIISSLKDRLRSMRVLSLTLVFLPTANEVDTIADWVKRNIGEDVVIDILSQKEIMSGVKISFCGKYADYSLRTKLNEFWKYALIDMTKVFNLDNL